MASNEERPSATHVETSEKNRLAEKKEIQPKLMHGQHNKFIRAIHRRAGRVTTHIDTFKTTIKWRLKPPPMFPQFSKLPPELQIKIWEFAVLLPRAIKLQATTPLGKMPGDKVLKIINATGSQPLLLTCFLAQQVALSTPGYRHMVFYYRPCMLSPGSPALSFAYFMDFNPGNDTIYVPNMSTLKNLAGRYQICAKQKQDLKAGVALIKSFAISRIVLPAKLPPNADCLPQLGAIFAATRSDFFTSIARFAGLEELIFVEPEYEGLSFGRNRLGRTLKHWDSGREAEWRGRIEGSLRFYFFCSEEKYAGSSEFWNCSCSSLGLVGFSCH